MYTVTHTMSLTCLFINISVLNTSGNLPSFATSSSLLSSSLPNYLPKNLFQKFPPSQVTRFHYTVHLCQWVHCSLLPPFLIYEPARNNRSVVTSTSSVITDVGGFLSRVSSPCLLDCLCCHLSHPRAERGY